MKRGRESIWPLPSSKMSPGASSVVYALKGAQPVPSPWNSIIANQHFTEGNKDEERDLTTHFRFGGVALVLTNRNTRYRSETIHVHLSQFLPPYLPGEDETPWSPILLSILSRRHFLPP